MILYLTDMEYGKRLVRYFNQIPEFSYEVVYFSEEQVLLNYLKKQKTCVLITQEQIELEPELYEKMEKIIYLVERQQDLYPRGQEVREKSVYFYQYQSMERLLALLLPSQEEIKQQECKLNQLQKDSKIISIFMPEDVCHASDTARMIAEEIKDKETSVYVSFVPFDQSIGAGWKMSEIQGSYGMSDLIYYLKEEPQEPRKMIQQVITKSRSLDLIHPVNHCLDLLEFQKEEVDQMICLLQDAGYSTIVAGISMMTQATVELLRKSKAILCLHSERMPQTWRERIKQQLAQVLPEDFKERYYEISLGNEKELLITIRKEIKEILGA